MSHLAQMQTLSYPYEKGAYGNFHKKQFSNMFERGVQNSFQNSFQNIFY